MSRHSQSSGSDAAFVIIILTSAVIWTHKSQLEHIAYPVLGIVSCLILLDICRRIVIRYRPTNYKDVDAMDGLKFEQYVAVLLRSNGFQNVTLTEKYDLGIDIIAEKNSIRWGIQVKRHSGLVKAVAVRQVVTALRLYGCDRPMVITNSVYSTVAKQLAIGNDCVLIDRLGLKELENNRGVIL